MPARIILSVSESHAEIDNLVNLIKASSSVQLRNRLLARRSRIMKHVQKKSADDVIFAQKDQILVLRGQVDTLLALLTAQTASSAVPVAAMAIDPPAAAEPGPLAKKKNASKSQPDAGEFPTFPATSFAAVQAANFHCSPGTSFESTVDIMCEAENNTADASADMLFGAL